MAAVLG
ncbi:hypothetical protein MIMGU_mgv1a0197392mg, partial [Erythranthe guttata]